MASTNNIIDKASKQFATQWDSVKRGVTPIYKQLLNSNLTNTERITAVAALDLQTTLVNNPAIKNMLSQMATTHIQVLKSMPAFAEVSDAFLTALIKVDSILYTGQIGATATQIQTLISQSLTSNLSEAGFIKALQTTGLTQAQAGSLANTSLWDYNRMVNKEMANNSPKNKLYKAIGPIDSRTRQICLDALAAGEMTLEQWEAQFGNYFVTGAGFNCRHSVVPA